LGKGDFFMRTTKRTVGNRRKKRKNRIHAYLVDMNEDGGALSEEATSRADFVCSPTHTRRIPVAVKETRPDKYREHRIRFHMMRVQNKEEFSAWG
jgi:hypothetical protein